MEPYIRKKSFDILPDEMMIHILSFLSDKEIHFSVKRVCKRFKNVADSFVNIGKPKQW